MIDLESLFLSWNPVWGCNNNCQFCFARKHAEKFYKKIAFKEWALQCDNSTNKLLSLESDIKNFKPIFLECNFNKKFPAESKNVFVNSMSDIAFWKPEWVKKIFDRIKEYPQHTFLFLTKGADYRKIENIYNDWLPENILWGNTVTTQNSLRDAYVTNYWDYVDYFISIEPILEKIDLNKLKLYEVDIPGRNYPKWVVVGAETGNRKNKVIPKKEWVEDIRLFCHDNNIPYFEKNSIREIVDRDLIQELLKLN